LVEEVMTAMRDFIKKWKSFLNFLDH
jgi:hypothetical protein